MLKYNLENYSGSMFFVIGKIIMLLFKKVNKSDELELEKRLLSLLREQGRKGKCHHD